MTRTFNVSICVLVLLASLFTPLVAQDRLLSYDSVQVDVTRAATSGALRLPWEAASMGTPQHPFEVKAFCGEESVRLGKCARVGDEFYDFQSHNLRTSNGTNWQFNQMGGTTAAIGNYLALTNTNITPAESDSTLSGEIVGSGLTRSVADSVSNASGTLGVPTAPSAAVTGGSTGTAVFYFVEACNQGICGLPSSASASVTPASTLNATNYVTISWTPVNGASTYVVIRSNSGSAISAGASLTGGATQASTGIVSTGTVGCSASTCTTIDASNTVNAGTAGTTANTNFGKYTIVKTWTASATVSAQAYGVFNASSSGILIFEGNFSSVTLNSGDTLQLTETVYFMLLGQGLPALLSAYLLGLVALAYQKRYRKNRAF